MRARLLAWGLALLVAGVGGGASADTVRVDAAAALKAPLQELAAGFTAAQGHTVALHFDTAGAAEQAFVGSGQRGLLATTDARIAQARAAGTLGAGRAMPLGETVAGLAVPPAGARPRIDSAAALKAALLGARRIAFSDPARGATVGTHFLRVLDALGVREAVLAKSVLARDGIETMRLVLAGEVDLGVTQVSEIVQADRAALLGPFPAEFDLATGYSLWLRTDADAPAQALADWLGRAQARDALAAHGLRVRP